MIELKRSIELGGLFLSGESERRRWNGAKGCHSVGLRGRKK